MAQLGIKSDGTPYAKRLSTRTRKLNLSNLDLISIDLAALSNAPNLENLGINRNPLRNLDLSPLSNCPNLQSLAISATEPIDIRPLASCANLRTLSIYSQEWPSIDLSPLAKLPHFEDLYINGSAFSSLDLSPFRNSAVFRKIYLHSPSLTNLDLSPLADCPKFERLGIEHAPLKSLELHPWPNLQYINFIGVPIKNLDLLPLHVSQLKRLFVVGNELNSIDLTPLVHQETLEDLFFKPLPTVLVDDVYVHSPRSVHSPIIRKYIQTSLVTATGYYTRLKVLIKQLMRTPSNTSPAYPNIDEAAFWRIISTAADGRDFASELTRQLWSLDQENLKRFNNLFWELMRLPSHEVHQTVYEVCGGCSDDAFMDFREWLIARGKQVFYQVVNTPQILAEWGEQRIGFTEGIISRPLLEVQQAKGISR